MLKEVHEGNWPGITAMVSISPVLEDGSYLLSIAWWQAVLHLHCWKSKVCATCLEALICLLCSTLQLNQASWLMALSKEAQYTVQTSRCGFLPPVSPVSSRMALVLCNPHGRQRFCHPSKRQDPIPAPLGNAEGSQRRQCFAWRDQHLNRRCDKCV